MKKKIWMIIKKNNKFLKITSKIYCFFMMNKIKKRNNEIINSGAYLKKCNIDIKGSKNKLIFDQKVRLNNCIIRINGNGCNLHIGESSTIENMVFHFEDNDCMILIGKNNIFSGGELAVAENKSKIEIGNSCLFSKNINIVTTDSHTIMDINTKNRINFAQNIKIGNKVWMGANVTLLKGSNIPNNTVIGRNATVTKAFYKENCILAGIPAKIVKENIQWEAERR